MGDCAALQCGEARDFLCSSAIAWKMKLGRKFNQNVQVSYELDEIIHLFDVMIFVYVKVIANEPLCNVL